MNKRNRIDFRLVNNSKKLRKLLNKPFFKDSTIYVPGLSETEDDFLVGVQMEQPMISLDQPMYTGQAILDNSKRAMYEYVYEYCIPKWGLENFKILQTDTDSVICEIRTEDLPADIKDDIPRWFDTSKYKRVDFDGTLIPKMNMKVLGKMKDELAGQFITEFASGGPKNYGFEYMKHDGQIDEKCVCKGISKQCTPGFFEYKSVVLGGKTDVKKTCFRIGSKEHEVSTIKTVKVAITNEIKKRLKDPTAKFETLPFGAQI